MADRLLTYVELRARGIGYSRQWLSKLEKAGRFPPRRQLGDNRVAWSEREVDRHIEELPRGSLPCGIGNGRPPK